MRRGERGAAKVEIALGIPLLVSLTVGMVWLLSIGTAQVRMVDAARETARAAARGEPGVDAVGLGRRVAPGADVSVSMQGREVTASARETVSPPGGLLGFLPGVVVRAEAVAVAERSP